MDLEPRFKAGDIVFYYRNDSLWEIGDGCIPVLCKTVIEDAYEQQDQNPRYRPHVCYHMGDGATVEEGDLFKTEGEARAWVNKEADAGTSCG